MPRPSKWRNVCCLPKKNTFGPLDNDNCPKDIIIMTVDEYEAVRLIDYEGYNQEECSKYMNIARTTAQAIYNRAKKKIAISFVEGKILRIEGGNYRLCDGEEKFCRHGIHCKRKCCTQGAINNECKNLNDK